MLARTSPKAGKDGGKASASGGEKTSGAAPARATPASGERAGLEGVSANHWSAPLFSPSARIGLGADVIGGTRGAAATPVSTAGGQEPAAKPHWSMPRFPPSALPGLGLRLERTSETLQRKACGGCASAKCDACAEGRREEGAQGQRDMVRRKESSVSPGALPGHAESSSVHSWARYGVERASRPLPHLRHIQAAFGSHDLSRVRASVGGAAAESSQAIGALAYTLGEHVAFKNEPDLKLAAHEAAHVVQQRNAAKLADGMGRAGDAFEQQADAVAEAVARGESAEGLLGAAATNPDGRLLVQRQEAGASGASGAGGGGGAGPAAGTEGAGGAPGGGSTTPAPAPREDPCAVEVPPLTNAALLSTFARTLAWLRNHRRSDDQYNDYSNLMRRLIAERSRRVNSGESWLGEDISSVPGALYRLKSEPEAPQRIRVTPVPGSEVAGASVGRSGQPVVTRGQYFQILERNRLPRIDPEEHYRQTHHSPLLMDLPLPEAPPTSFCDATGMGYDPLNPFALGAPLTPQGLTGGAVVGFGPSFAAGPTPTAGDSLQGFLGEVWAAHQRTPMANSDPIYGMYNTRPAPVPATADPAAYRAEVLTLSRGSTAPQIQVGSRILSVNEVPPGANEAFYHYSPQTSPIQYRVYVSAAPDHALDLMRVVVQELVEGPSGGVPASKVGAQRIVSNRRDGLVVTATDLPALERILLRLRALQQSNPTWLLGEPVAMTDPIMPSVGLGVEPPSHASFGDERSRLLFEALRSATTEAEFRAEVAKRLGASGVDPLAPHAQRDLPTLGPERRAWLQAGGSSVGGYHLGGLRSPAAVGAGLGAGLGGVLTAGHVLLNPNQHPHAMRDIGLGVGGGALQGYTAGQIEFAMNARLAPTQYTRFNATWGQGMRGMVMPRMGSGAVGGGVTAIGVTLATLGVRQAFFNEDITSADYAALGARAGFSGTIAGAGGAGAAALTGFIAGSEVPLLGNVVGAGIGLLLYWGSDSLFGQSVENGVRGLLGEGGCQR